MYLQERLFYLVCVSRELEAVLCNTSDMIGVGTGSHVQYTVFPK